MNLLGAVAPMALGMAPGGIGQAMNLVNGVQSTAALAETAGNALGVQPKHKHTVGSPMTRVAADLRLMAAEAAPAALTSTGATGRTDKVVMPASNLGTPAAAGKSAAVIISNVDHGSISTQRPVIQPAAPGGGGKAPSPGAPPSGLPAKSGLPSTKVAVLSWVRPAWRATKSGLSSLATHVAKAKPFAEHAIAFGGAALTAKGLYDAMRSEKDRDANLAEIEAEKNRQREFHEARMRMLEASTNAMPLLADAYDPATGHTMDLGQASDIPASSFDVQRLQPFDMAKTSGFNLTYNSDMPEPYRTGDHGNEQPGTLAELDMMLGKPLNQAVGPYGINFDHSTVSPTIRL